MKKITFVLLLMTFPSVSSSQEIKIGQSAEEIKYIVGMGVNYVPNASWDVQYKNGQISHIILCYNNEYLIDIGVSANFCKNFVMEDEKLAYILTQYENLSVDQIKTYYNNMENQIKDGDKYHDRNYVHSSRVYLHENGLATVDWRKNLNINNDNATFVDPKNNELRFDKVWNVKEKKSNGLARFSIKIFEDYSCYIEMTIKGEIYKSIICEEDKAVLSNGKNTLNIRYGMPELEGVDIFIENNGSAKIFSSWDVQN